MNKVLLLIENGFEDTEAMYPYYRMQEAGLEVHVVGPSKGTFHGKYGYPLRADMTPADCDLEGVAAVIIPGGHAPDRMRTRPEMVRLVREAVERGIVVGAICHGPLLLIEAGVLRGRRATCYSGIRSDLADAGALYEDSKVVVDRNIVTSRIPSDLPAFAGTLVAMVQKKTTQPEKVGG